MEKRLRKGAENMPKPPKTSPKKPASKGGIAAGALSLILIVFVIVFVCRICGGKGQPVPAVQMPETVVAASATAVPVPTAVPEPTATPKPAVYLPVYETVETNEKQIAITINDPVETNYFDKVIDLTVKNGGKITIFPLGFNAQTNSAMQTSLRRAYELGFEIENYTYTNVSLYSVDDGELAEEIFMGNQAVSKMLGVNYEMHFLRPKNLMGMNDLRTHQYLEQLGGYVGIAGAAVNGTKTSLRGCKNALGNGVIYAFTTSYDDYVKLKEFIPYAAEHGYRLVTLNELVGCGPNAVSEYAEATAPLPYPFIYSEYVDLGTKDYSQLYAVRLLQERLIELGYLPSDTDADGYYGDITRQAVTEFQTAMGINADGYAGKSTQEKLFSDEAVRK